MIRPGVPAPNLAPRLGSEVVRERSGVEYRELRARSLVNRCDSPRVPFEWTVNPYRGCAMGCRYCYAAYTHEYLGHEAAASFHSTIYAKSFAPDETLPWDFIDHAVDKRYLLAERRKAHQEVQTPPCDTHTCHSCGAC